MMNIDEWSKKFQGVLREMPIEDYWLYVGNGTLYLMRVDDVGDPTIDEELIVETYDCPNFIDGGDW